MPSQCGIAATILAISMSAVPVPAPAAAATTRNVPSQYATIQAAINASVNGDVVLLAPGLYKQSVTITDKSITLASLFHTTGDTSYVRQTVMDGNGSGWVVRVNPTRVPTLSGLTIQNADDGVRAYGKVRILDSHITNAGDGADFEGGSGGLVLRSTLDRCTDDGIDVDNHVTVLVRESFIQDNGDDGIEIRLQGYVGPRLSITILNNLIARNDEDGIQLISSNIATPRTIRIEGNLIVDNRMAGVGMMCCENTVEDYQGASILERVGLYNNTISGNDHGVTGGDSVVALNNLIVNSTHVALKNVDAGSYTAHNLFFANGTNIQASNVDMATTLFVDPLLRPDWGVGAASPGRDAGTATYEVNGEILWERDPTLYWGPAPDIGAVELLEVLGVGPSVTGGVRLAPPIPNPTNGAVRLQAHLPVTSRVRLEVVDVSGRLVRMLIDETRNAGPFEHTWDGRDTSGSRAAAGVYYARLRTPAGAHAQRFVRVH